MMIKVGIFIVLVLLSANSILAQSNRSGQTPNSGQGNGVSPSTAIIFICLVSAFFLMGFISVYVRHCSERRNSFTDYDGTGSFRQSRGLDPAAVQAFPTFFYSDVKGHKLGQTALECAVCLLEFEDDEVLRLLPKCSHVFHPDCIGAWLAFHVTCPVCRANLVPAPGELNRVISLCRDADNDAIEPHAPTHNGTVDFMIDVESPEFVHTSKSPNQNVPRRSTPRRSRNTGKYPRSHSTGHSVVQPGENCERFTLRLPEGVRSQLVNSTGLRRSMSVVAFPRERSSRKGFRSNSVGTAGGKRYENYERFDQGARSGRWNFRLTPPFISRTGSTSGVGGEDLTATPRTLMRSIKSPLDRLFRGVDKDNVGERSTDRLRPEDFA